ncbi:MAG TPA: acyl-CoA dehydrogenase, partial [Desulfobacteraceae bacterium]|nr:acyl-CoA dehydrogenase [Desulfobacteraceae bacterium]
VGVPLHSDVVTPYIYSYGRPEIKERWLPGCATGEVITAVGFTEPNAGSDLAAIRTKGVRKGDSYAISGQKTFITNGAFADLIVVAVKTDSDAGYKGISLILVDKDAPGFSRGRKLEKMGYHMQDTAELFFDNCRVPASHLLGEVGSGFKYMMEKLQQERLEVCIKCQVNAEEALKEAIDYAKVREAFGRRIGDHQQIAFKLAEMATEVELGRTFLDRLIEDHIRGKNIVQRVSMAKYWLGEMVNRIAYQAVQIHGGYGYMEEYRICRIYRDVRALSIFAGTSEIMKLIISRNLGLKA